MSDSAISILLIVVPTVLAFLLYWQLDKRWPGGTVVSLVAFGFFALSFLIPDDHTREINLMIGLLRINGIIGIILGTFSYLRHRSRRGQATDTETKPGLKTQSNPNKCPQCGLVNRTIDSSCQRCGAPLRKRKTD